jgi:hypothetical protein
MTDETGSVGEAALEQAASSGNTSHDSGDWGTIAVTATPELCLGSMDLPGMDAEEDAE